MKCRIFTCLALLFISIVMFSCKDKTNNPEENINKEPIDLLPRSGEISGWTKSTGAGDFKEASDEVSLYEILDGGASDYIQYGFIMGVSQKYSGSIGGASVELELRVFDHTATIRMRRRFTIFERTRKWPELHHPQNLGPRDVLI